MTRFRAFFTAIRNNLFALVLFLVVWAAASLFFPPYIVPSPLAVLRETPVYFQPAMLHHLVVTLYRISVGFIIAVCGGTLLAIIAAPLRKTAQLTTLMSLFEVLPGMIVGIIFLLIFGLGHGVPIGLVAFLTLPAIAINTSGGLAKKNRLLEDYLRSIGGTRRHMLRNIYLPVLVPTLQSNLTMGFSHALKIVILGEFIGSQDGIGYLLNVAKIYFNMNAVFFHLSIVLLLMLVFQVVQQLLFLLFLGKYFYAE